MAQAVRFGGGGNTGILYGDGGAASLVSGDSRLPRSIASDGRRSVLLFHVAVHVMALTFNAITCAYAFDSFPQTTMRVLVILAVALHAVGIVALLALAASQRRQIAYTFGLSFVFFGLLAGLSASIVSIVFSFRSDDKMTVPLWAGYGTIALQLLGFSLLLSTSLGMASHGDDAMATVGGGIAIAEKQPLATA